MQAKWQAIKEHAEMGLKELFPLNSKHRQLVLDSVEIKEPDASVDSQRKALVNGTNLTAAVYGNFSLIDLAGQRVLNRDRVKILDLPIVTHRGTFVVQGKDYSVFNQTRLRPGVYTSKAEDSDVVSSKFNLGKGLGFKIQLSSDASVFHVVFDASKANTGGQSKIPLYSVLRALGATDGEIKARWGEKLFASNVAKSNIAEDVKHIVALVVYVGRRTGNDVADIRDYFNGTQLNGDTTKVTLGHAYHKVTAGALLDATSKIIRVYKDEDTSDDLDSLLYKEVLSAEDHIFLRISKGAKEPNGVLAKLRRRMDNVTLERTGPGGKKVTGPAETVKQAVALNLFSQMVEKFFTTSSLSAPQTEINPIEILETNHKITAMGEGGISSEHGIPMSARNLHTSHFGFLDPVRTTESTRVGVDLRMTANAFVKNRNIYSKFLDRNGKEVKLRPVELNDKVVGFPGQDGHNPVKAMKSGESIEVDRSRVDFWMERPSDMFTYTSNMVPFLHNDQGNRVTMASRMVTQAVPLVNPEAPYVQIKSEGGKHPSYEQELGKEYFTPKSPESGTVKEINEKFIRVNNSKVDIYTNFPLNYKCVSGKSTINVLKSDGSIYRGNTDSYVFVKGDRIQSIDINTSKSAWVPIEAFQVLKNDKKLYKVSYKSGRSVVCTEDHSLVTLDDTGNLTKILPDACIVGKTMSPIAMMPSIESTVGSYNLGAFTGLYLAEGHLAEQAGLIMIAVTGLERVQAAIDLIASLDSTYKPYKSGGCVCLTNHSLYAWLKNNCGRLSGNKFISGELFSYSTEFKKGLISGYMAGNGVLAVGSKNDIQVWAASTSRTLRDDLVDMLSELGVFSTIRDEPRTEYNDNWNDAYAFRICSGELSKLSTWFFYDDREELLRNNLKDNFRSSKFYNIPVTKLARKALYAEIGDGITHMAYKTVSERGYISKSRVVGKASVYGKWASSDVMWDTVTKIEEAPTEDLVYDFTISDSHVFAVNGGLVVHNTYIHMTPIVKVGDFVKQGQQLAESNFTDKGTLAIGTNLKVAYIPYKGWNHEDGLVVSQSAVKKLTSQHMYVKELDLSNEVEVDKRKMAIMFPSKITSDQLRKLDDEGIAIKGQIVSRGDYVICALAKREPTTSDSLLTKMHGSLANQYKDVSLVWDHDRPGTVTDIVRTNHMVKVILLTEDESVVGDKLCYSPDTEVLTEHGWVQFPELTMDDKVCCLNPDGDLIEYHKPSLVANWDHDGDMYHVENDFIDLNVTPDHYMWVRFHGSDKYLKAQARDIKGQYVHYKRNGNWVKRDTPFFTIPGVEHKHAKYKGDKKVRMNDWLEFLGYYLSEGSSTSCNGNNSVDVHQIQSVHPETYDKIFNVLVRMGYNPHKLHDRIRVHNKQLYELCYSFGYAEDKRIPRYALMCSSKQSKILLDALMEGDGHWYSDTGGVYVSISKGLCDDVQELSLKCGWSGSVRPKNPARIDIIKGKPYECKASYNCFIQKTKNEPGVNHRKLIEKNDSYYKYSGKVYCCTVPTGILFVRRNGMVSVSSNTGRHGNKGTITMILPDNEMPHDAKGVPMDMLLNPASVISRVNPGQLYDTMAGKLAEHQGKPYLVENFSPADSSKKVLAQMAAGGVSPEEDLIDPKTKKVLGKVFIGNQYTLKLHKQTEGNFAARSTARYDTNQQPAKGGEDGAKAVGLQDFYALLGHNARHNIREMAAFKSQKNTEFWNAIQLGTPLPPAKETFAFEKFKALLGATGINVHHGEGTYQITPTTDKDVMSKSSGEVKSGLMLKGNVSTMVPEDNGLFDKRVTGGLHGTHWNHIELAEPIVHPLFHKVVKAIVHKDPTALTGHEMHEELSKINVDARLAELRLELQRVKGSSRDKVIKQIKYLTALNKMGMHPKDYMLTKFPIIPPQYRPIYPSPSGGAPMVSDLNNLYRDLINTNEALKELKDFPDEDKKELRSHLSQAAGAVVGMTDPINVKSKKQDAKGALKVITGNTAKDGFFHRKIMYRTQDGTGRGTILPNPNLHIDEVEIPKEMAFQLFRPFVVNNMIKKGVPMPEALRHVADHSTAAHFALKEEMGKRPVILNRAPTLHKYNVMAFKPIAVEGKSIFIPPLVIKGFNADFDGDSVSGDTYVLVEIDGVIELKQIRDVE